ncbi:hypothetical protein Palpr_1087 [Paludibacter propionicigenes WB4]|uniref:Fibrobacter succinogenes major paralogous domain-containing protein n=1 Tax=Paludibacter propionicigenes (strain DSM 17365 / JCM 13257 / WB4) TaxID=694427 RepID=E4T3E1_PALPW|nr:hypothetical protein [Paludibacter propionicigenes]ADQ79235.1 hypothetical protein Palpr_1087 [Paludibacter propionicigenes WB4]
MKKKLVFLYLSLMFSTVRGQYPAALPSSGAISVKAISDWMLTAGEITAGTYSISDLNNKSHLTDKTAPYSLSDWYGYGAIPFTSCGNSFSVAHYAGSVSPVSKLITYTTVSTNVSGTTKCWITQNLGAEHSATSVNDATAASGGWYWQFNRAQGIKVGDDGIITPTSWYTSITENSDWTAANDPCTLLLGSGWRMPTYSEWVTVGNNAAFGSTALSYTSVLKLHGAGFSYSGSTFVLTNRGYNLSTWSSTQADATTGWEASDQGSHQPLLYNVPKGCAMPLRCLK